MSYFRAALIAYLTLALLGACAGIDEPEPGIVDPDPITKTINMAYWGSLASEPGIESAGWIWELTVDPTPIVSSELFAADLRGRAIFGESILNQIRLALGVGFTEVMVVGFKATVHVRRGAIGDDVVLTPEPVPYVCAISKTACDPENDLPGTPGIRGNTDCQPEGAINPCGQLFEIPTSDDCAPGGFCEGEGRTGPGSQCQTDGFCISGPVAVALAARLGSYRADASGNVLFGFDDQNTSAELLEEGGCNDGTYVMPVPRFEDPIGPSGLRAIAGSVPGAMEFVMGENSRGPFGIDSCDALASPTPDSRLISFPIQTP